MQDRQFKTGWSAWGLLLLLVAGGLVLRLWTIGWGLPATYHPDETQKVKAIAHMMENRGDPGYFKHPGFLLYSCTAAALVGHHAFGLPWDVVSIQYVGRIWTAILGGLTIGAVFLLARELAAGVVRSWSEASMEWATLAPTGSGLIAAAVFASLPLHVTCSHYIKEDVPLTLFTTLSLLFAIRVARSGCGLTAATVFGALAFSTKYTGVLSLLLVPVAWFFHAGWAETCRSMAGWGKRLLVGLRRSLLLALLTIAAYFAAKKHQPAQATLVLSLGLGLSFLSLAVWGWMLARKRVKAPRLSRAGRLCLLVLAIFFLLNPYAILNARTFGADFDYEAQHGLRKGHHGVRISPWQHAWTFHIAQSLAPGMTMPVLVIAGLAFLACMCRKDKGLRFAGLMVLFYYLVHEASELKPPPNFDRYMIPILPGFAAFLGVGWLLVARGELKSRIVFVCTAALCTGLLLVPPVLKSVRLVQEMEPDTRDQLLAWMKVPENIPPGSFVLLNGYGPQLEGVSLAFEYHIASYLHLTRHGDGPLRLKEGMYRTGQRSPETMQDNSVDFVVTSSFWTDRYRKAYRPTLSGKHEAAPAFYRALEARWGPPVAVFETPCGSYGYNNPVLKVYRRPDFLRPAPRTLVWSGP